jgi:hypothetical protein
MRMCTAATVKLKSCLPVPPARRRSESAAAVTSDCHSRTHMMMTEHPHACAHTGSVSANPQRRAVCLKGDHQIHHHVEQTRFSCTRTPLKSHTRPRLWAHGPQTSWAGRCRHESVTGLPAADTPAPGSQPQPHKQYTRSQKTKCLAVRAVQASMRFMVKYADKFILRHVMESQALCVKTCVVCGRPPCARTQQDCSRACRRRQGCAPAGGFGSSTRLRVWNESLTRPQRFSECVS